MSIVFVVRRMQKRSCFIMVIFCLHLTTQSQCRECFSLGWILRHSKEHTVLLSDEVDWKKDLFFPLKEKKPTIFEPWKHIHILANFSLLLRYRQNWNLSVEIPKRDQMDAWKHGHYLLWLTDCPSCEGNLNNPVDWFLVFLPLIKYVWTFESRRISYWGWWQGNVWCCSGNFNKKPRCVACLCCHLVTRSCSASFACGLSCLVLLLHPPVSPSTVTKYLVCQLCLNFAAISSSSPAYRL